MSDKDEFDEQVEQLLPCLKNLVVVCRPDYLCTACRVRPAVAAALREQGKSLANWKQVAFESDQAKGCLEEQLADLRTELAKAQEARDSINSELIITTRKYKKQTHLLAEHISEAERLMSLWVKSDAELASLEGSLPNSAPKSTDSRRSLP